MKQSVSVTCPKCGQPVMFKLSSSTLGGDSKGCIKCGKLVIINYRTERDGNILELRIV